MSIIFSEAKNFNLGVAFDASHVRGKTADYKGTLDFNNLDATRHVENLEFDYQYFRDRGVNFFRDGSLMYKTCPDNHTYNWDYLDRVAKQEGDIQLSLSHYEFPTWVSQADILEGKFASFLAEFSLQVAERYKNRFHSIIPAVEIGYWCHMMSSWARWNPLADSWWQVYEMVMGAVIESAKVLRSHDIPVALSEPFGLECPITDQARPFLNLLGHPDPIAVDNGCRWQGEEDLLQILGLNYYRLDTIESSISELKALVPNKEIIIAESGNCHHPHMSPEQWLEELDAIGKVVDLVVWSPGIEMSNFEFGEPTGGYLLSRERSLDNKKKTGD